MVYVSVGEMYVGEGPLPIWLGPMFRATTRMVAPAAGASVGMSWLEPTSVTEEMEGGK